jgi:Zn-dependent protease with chaperone function
MSQIELDFAKYVRQRRGMEEGGLDRGAPYAYAGDQRVLRALDRVTPVKLAAEATVRLWRNVARGQLLGGCVKVTERQFEEIYRLSLDCARKLQIPLPSIYVAPEVGLLNAHTFGTRDSADIVINGVLVDHLDLDELAFVIGHECGHIQNNHVVFNTALYYLTHSANIFVRWIVQPAVLALRSWARRAEITCDRAGMLCCGDLDVATRALVKLALGSQRLADRLDIEEYLKQLDESREGVGGVAELVQDHPYLPKRVAALRLFSQTHFFCQHVGLAGEDVPARSLNWCDSRVGELLSFFRSEGEDGDRREGDDEREVASSDK